MKKYFGLLIIIVLMFGIYIIFNKDNKSVSNEVLESTNEEIKPTGMNSLAIMLQNEEGEYVVSDSDTWPTDEYVFNDVLSSCENGGTLSWNDGKITLKTKGSDKCYVYFDKTNPSSFQIVDMQTDFYTHCSIQISNDKGNTWQDYQLSAIKENITKINEGTIIRVNNKDNFNLFCSINICENSSCSKGDSSTDTCSNYPATSGENNTNNGRRDFVVLGGKSYFYALTYCTCLTGDNDIWVEEKKKRRKKKINELRKGDKILVIDEKTGKIITKKVREIRVNKVNIICKITLENGEIIRSSMRHVFVVENLGDAIAEELKVGYKLLDALGNYKKIKDIKIENYQEGIEVYSIIPEDSKSIKRIIISSLIATGAFGSNIMLAFAANRCEALPPID